MEGVLGEREAVFLKAAGGPAASVHAEGGGVEMHIPGVPPTPARS